MDFRLFKGIKVNFFFQKSIEIENFTALMMFDLPSLMHH
jgi:hypothetical protein